MHTGALPEPRTRGAAWLGPLVFLAALLPTLGTWHAPWIAEDAAMLARVAEEGAFADWARPWFDAEIVRFWRPLVTTSFGLQYASVGLDPFALRLLNLVLHAGAAVLVARLVRRLGGGAAAALAAGLAAGWFPAQGGTVVWLSGRTDLLSGFLLLASVVAVLGRHAWLAAPLAFLAASAKEFGFLALPWGCLFLAAEAGGWRVAARRAWPLLVGTGVAFVARAWALGGIAGGYAGELPTPFAALAGALHALLAPPHAFGVVGLLLVAGLFVRRAPRARRVLGAGLCAALLALALLAQLLADGQLESENERLLYVPWLALAVALGALLEGLPTAARFAPLALCPLVLSAGQDARAWRNAAELGASHVEAARARVAALAPGDAPVLFTDFPRSAGGAYVLSFGLAQRFRAPFPAAPRPVWPWRLLFVEDPARERRPLSQRADGAILPLDEDPPVAVLELLTQGAPAQRLEVDARSLASAPSDESQPLRVQGGPPGAALELLVFTEAGYETFPAGALDAAGAGAVTLRQLLQLGNGATLAILVLDQAADLGAQRAYLELRALAADGSVAAASRWCELAWRDEVRRAR